MIHQPEVCTPQRPFPSAGWRLLAALATLAAMGLTAAKGAQEYHHSFKGDPANQQGFELTGPDANQCVQFEPAGLRITLPAGYGAERPSTGVILHRTVKGDFEITLDFEILKEPTPADTGKFGTRLSLGIFQDTARPNVATVNRSVGAQSGRVFVSWASLWNSVSGKAEPKAAKPTPTGAMTGRLRLVRTGSDLSYYAAEGASDKFTFLHKVAFGTPDLKQVRIIASTGGPKSSLDVRVTDLLIRAELSASRPAETPVDAVQDVESQPESRSWLVAIGILGLVFLLALAIGIGLWLYLRQSRAAGTPALGAEAFPPSVVAFACDCGKSLKARPELEGKKVKCSQCGKAVLVPSARLDETDRISS